jgi:sensor histidine kinase regulating citrate/malate metabolism
MAGSAVINKYREKIEEKGIRFICIGKFPEEIGNISDVDICTILSNLLKNALEAAVLYDGALEKKIQLLIQWYNTEILLKITNPSNAVGDLSGTSKADKKNHGIGLQNVKDAVEKYHGYLKTEYEKEIFCVRIVLPIGENDTQI